MSFLKKSKENERKALVRVLKMDSSGNFVKEVLGFGVRMRKNEETNSFMFITSSSVLNSFQCDLEGIVAERYCPKKKKSKDRTDQREKVYEVMNSVDDHVSFAFFSGQSEEGFLEIDDGTFLRETLPMAMQKILYAYAFEGKELVELTFDKNSYNKYELKDVSKGNFQVTNAKGAPIIAYDPYSEKPMIVGILHITSDGTLYPVLLTEKHLDVKSKPAKQPQGNDEKCSTIPNSAENGKPDPGPTTVEGAEGNNSDEGNGKTEAALGKDEYDKAIHPSDTEPKDEKDSSITYDGKPGSQFVAGLHATGAGAVGTNSNGENKETVKSSASVFQEETKCFKYKTINEALPDKLLRKLEIKLDPDRPLGGDLRSLADAYGYNLEEINYFKNLECPTKNFLKQEGGSTLLFLRENLEKIKRYDAAKPIDDHIRDSCDCEDCGSLR